MTLNIGLIAAETQSPLTVNDGDTRSVVPHRSVGMSDHTPLPITGHDHITTRLLQLSASRLTTVHTRPTAEAVECCSTGYIQCWQAGTGTRLTVP